MFPKVKNRLRRQKREFEKLYNTHYIMIRVQAFKLCSNKEDVANELVQETFVKAYRYFDSFDGRNPKAWLKTILRNAYFDFYKKKKKEYELFSSKELDDATRSHIVETSEEIDEATFESLLETLSNNPTSEDWKTDLASFVGDEIIQSLDELSPPYRAALLLQHVTELSYEEISETMDCKIGTVMSRLSRARDAFKKALVKNGGLIGKRLQSLEHLEELSTKHSQTDTIKKIHSKNG